MNDSRSDKDIEINSKLSDSDVEQTVLANLISISPCKEREEIINLLSVNDFFYEDHQIIYRVIKQLKNVHLDTLIVFSHIKKAQRSNIVSSNDMLELFEHRTGSILSTKHHANIVRELSLLRQIVVTGKNMTQLALSLKGNATDVIAKCSQDIDQLNKSIKPPDVKSRTFSELIDEDFPELDYLLYPVMRITNQIIVHAEAGVGKTLFVHELAYAIATSGSAFGWNAPKPRSVLIVDGEMSLRDIQTRFKDVRERNGGNPENRFNIMSFSDFEDDINLIQPQWQVIVNQKIEELKAELVIFDNLDSLFSVDQNKQVEWMPAQIWLKRLRNDGIATILVHHSNKQRKSFGTTAVTRNPNLILALNHPDDYDAEDGAIFDVKVDKARELRNSSAATFRCKLTDQGWELTESPISVKGVRKAIIECLKDGGGMMHSKEIAGELEKSQSNVKSILTGLVRDGLVVKLGKGKYELADLPASLPSDNQKSTKG